MENIRRLSWLAGFLLYSTLSSAQLLERVYAEKSNANFTYEYRGDKYGQWTEFILKAKADSIQGAVIIISGQRDIRNFLLYMECHIKECFKDDQPLFLPGMEKLFYHKETRDYRNENGVKAFERKKFLSFLRSVAKKAKKQNIFNIRYKRKKYFY